MYTFRQPTFLFHSTPVVWNCLMYACSSVSVLFQALTHPACVASLQHRSIRLTRHSNASKISTYLQRLHHVSCPPKNCWPRASIQKNAFSALTLLIGWQEGHLACKKMGGCWRWTLVSPDGVAPSWMVGVSASVNLPLHKVQKFSSGTGSPGWSRKRAVKRLWCGGGTTATTTTTITTTAAAATTTIATTSA